MSLLQASFLRRPLFVPSQDKDSLSYKLFWIAVFAAFVIVNAPPKRVSPLVIEILQIAPERWLRDVFQHHDLPTLAETIVLLLIVPLKKLCFFLALLVIGYPVTQALLQSTSFWKALKLKRIALSSLLLFFLLSALVLPYANPSGPFIHRSGLSGLGVLFGEMSAAPFASNNDIVYGRVLKPALANYFHMDGFARYYLFSLACTYLLVFLTLTFLESKVAAETAGHEAELPGPIVRWSVYVSAMTSSFIMTSFQSPGKVDQVVFIFILLMACLPMTPLARLGIVALCVVTHEAIALTLVPMIVFWFPKDEKPRALLVIGLFYVVMAASYGLNVSQAFAGHGTTVKEGAVWQIIIEYPGYFILGLFFSYKLFWGVFLYVLSKLWTRNEFNTVLGLAAVVFLPVLLCVLAWDTTRIAGVGFLGMLMALVILLRDFKDLPKFESRLLRAALSANVLIPSYNVILYPPVGDGPPVYLNSLSDYPYLGLYGLIHSVGRMILP